MPHLLFVCTGNVCRSPFAERFARHLLDGTSQGSQWSISSVGTDALSGHPMDALMAAELERRGVSSDGFSARQATFDRLEESTLIMAMTAEQRSWVLEESPRALNRAFTLGQVARFVREDDCDARGEEFLASLARHRSRPRRRDDIPDPFRRGPEAAAAAAHVMTEALIPLVPRLVQA